MLNLSEYFLFEKNDFFEYITWLEKKKYNEEFIICIFYSYRFLFFNKKKFLFFFLDFNQTNLGNSANYFNEIKAEIFTLIDDFERK